MSKLKFGADPEFALTYADEGEKYILPPVVLRTDFGCAYEENGRHPIFKRYGETLVHEDGAAFEMSVKPSYNWRDIWNDIQEAKSRFAEDVLSKLSDFCNPVLESLPSVKYQWDKWITRGPEFQESTEFGCDPDQDVYNTRVKCKVMDASRHPWRYMGGHIHASGLDSLNEYPLIAIRCMVMTAGLASCAYSDSPELDRERLFLYGKPGKFRIQTYSNGETGIEYRTPSTRWTGNLSLAERVFHWADIGLNILLDKNLFQELDGDLEKSAVNAILSFDQGAALGILNHIENRI